MSAVSPFSVAVYSMMRKITLGGEDVDYVCVHS